MCGNTQRRFHLCRCNWDLKEHCVVRERNACGLEEYSERVEDCDIYIYIRFYVSTVNEK